MTVFYQGDRAHATKLFILFRRIESCTFGYTMIEMMVVLALIGILAAIILPSWLTFKTTRTLNAAQDQVYQAMRLAQSEAANFQIYRQVSFRQVNRALQFSIHNPNLVPVPAQWQSLPLGVEIDTRETTLLRSGGLYRVVYDDHGNVSGQLGRLTIKSQNGSSPRRCVIVSTLLGALRRGQNQTKVDDNGRMCY